MTWQQGYGISGPHELLVYFDTWATFLKSNLNLTNHDRLSLNLSNGVYNEASVHYCAIYSSLKNI